ncbi:hypothetical protein [Pararhizobium sp. PWRC1-1]|uniref:hypothetical protein n=1 Tax=Pararhizobium sp. PWRC1-1 TaxID=2804566 RepID=UPI003CF2E37C
MKNGINASLRASCAAKTKDALIAIDEVIASLENEITDGTFEMRVSTTGKLLISHRNISQMAGRNPNFLYKHPATLDYVEAALLAMLETHLSRATRSLPANPSGPDLLMQYQKLADRAHTWWMELRAVRGELRQVKATMAPKIVPLKGK